jgi:aminoglycoside phosphotransferase (APT) family kinase protein
MTILQPSLLTWIESISGTKVETVEELTGGASRNSFVITGKDGGKCFLRLDAGHGPLSGTHFTLEREFEVLVQMQGHGVPMARVYAFSAEHNAILMEFIPGYTSYQKTGSPAEEAELHRSLMRTVVAIQKVDPRTFRNLGSYCSAPLGIAIPADLKGWRTLYDERVAIHDPVVEFALHWLSQAVPDPDAPAVIVHGDMGPGNFLIENGEIKALIDWEMTRVGHPLEDVACIIARSLGAPFGEPSEHVRNYEALTGTRVDSRKLDYALSLVITRWQVAMGMALSRPSVLQNVPMLFAFLQINSRALTDALCRQNDVTLTDTPVQFRRADSCFSVFTYATDCLTQMAADAAIGAAGSYKLKGVVDLLSYLRSFIDYGPETYEREEIERITAIVGRRVVDSRDANAAICRHAREVPMSSARPLVEYLHWRCQREQAIMRTSLGIRKDNRIRYD